MRLIRTEPVALVAALEGVALAVWALVVILFNIDAEVSAAVVAIIAAVVVLLGVVVRGLVSPVDSGGE